MKHVLFYLIRLFKEKKISPQDFCNEYYMIYDINNDKLQLSDFERESLKKISVRASRFTDIEEDFEKHKDVYFSSKDLYEITEEVFDELEIINKTPNYS
ncbi:hypothetical protein [Winogradskyella sp.]|uniref:hypothetical protein n=1 Tax=Winogradskyella sp. TaxID=1883156 RepID=UPI0026183900|nr:hypothetical protein [Winogradskyella sp.]